MSKTAILFPGQGSQGVQMGKELAEKNPEIMQLWEKAEKYSSLPLREIYWESNDETLMAFTANLQPALTVANLGIWLEYSSKLEPAAFAGHSLGEFSALAAAKVLTFDEVLKLVTLRGKLMAEADPNKEGTMYVVLRLSKDDIEPVVAEVTEKTGKIVRIANYNTPKQFAISGYKDSVDEAVEELKQKEGRAKCIPLAVSGAFHSPLMAEANKEFTKELANMEWKNPICPIYANVHPEAIVDGNNMHNLMKKQMVSSVHWYQAVNAMYANGINSFAEFGPKGVLIRMIPHILTAEDVECHHFE